MVKVDSIIAIRKSTAIKIQVAWEERFSKEPLRTYLGASAIGNGCERYLWYSFRHAFKPSFSGRILRLFDTGHHEEPRMAADLRMIGCTVHDIDSSGNQFAVSAVGGHFSGHMDGCVLGLPEAPKTWHLVEYKTHNAKSFRALEKKGVQESKPLHYDQMQVYMHLSGMKRALYMAKNKDDESMYLERVRYDKKHGEFLIEKAKYIINSQHAPDRISEKKDFYLCSWCDARDVCLNSGETCATAISSVSCRQCCHATPEMDGIARWSCGKLGKSLSKEDQEKACDEHLCLPDLVSATAIGGNADNVEFENEDKSKWTHGKGGWSTKDIMSIGVKDLVSGMINSVREIFGCNSAGMNNDVLSRYPESSTKVIWSGIKTDLTRMWKKQYGTDMSREDEVASSYAEGDRNVIEFSGGRLAVVYPDTNIAEIREGVE